MHAVFVARSRVRACDEDCFTVGKSVAPRKPSTILGSRPPCWAYACPYGSFYELAVLLSSVLTRRAPLFGVHIGALVETPYGYGLRV